MSRFLDKKLETLTPYVPGEQPKNIKNLIKLNTNESPFPPSEKVVAAITSERVREFRLYPDPECRALSEAIADVYKVAPEQIFIGNGSDEILGFCFHGLCGDGAAFADVTYGFFPVYAEMFGVKTETVPLRGNFTIAPEDYAHVRGTVIIANPNAITGIFLPLTKIEEILSQNPSRLVIIDEAYCDFGGESAIQLLPRYENLLIVQTFSKSRQMAGGRLGFAIGAKELIKDLSTMKFSFNPYNINRLTLTAAEVAVLDGEYFEKCRRTIMENREYTVGTLREMGFEVLPSRANFILAKPAGVRAFEYYEALRQKGILVRYFDAARVRDYVRITIGTKEQMNTLIDATKQILGRED